MEKIDFVIIWVDGNDPNWLSEYKKYKSSNSEDDRIIRFRDWDNLKYWFRGIEKFTPWVNKVHFVTCGHYPKWLNLNSPKLNFIKHSDYIPKKYLPTFNSHTIELNLHRIPNLSEKFVYFNDDMFIIKPIDSSRFFRRGLPCDMAVLNAISTHAIGHIIYNNIGIINSYCVKKDVIKHNFSKWFNYKYGIELLRTLLLLLWPKFTGFTDPHIPNSFLKSTLEDVWKFSEKELNETCNHKFRNIADVNQYLFRYWQLVNGAFYSYNTKNDSIDIPVMKENINVIKRLIEKQEKTIICLNDECYSEFEYCKNEIIKSFESIFPDKSSFEL